MKNKVKSHRPYRSFASVTAAIVLALFCLQGCKKYYDPPFVFEEQAVNNKKKRKVLLISVDGATGEDVKTIMPPQIAELLKNSKYCWNASSDFKSNDGSTWKNIMTGVGVGKHGIIDNTLEIPSADDGDEHATVNYYPSFIERLQESGKMKYSVGITPWKTLADKLFIYGTQAITVANDAAVKDSTLNKINEQKNDLIIADFTSVSDAGKQYGFSADVPEYKNAMLTVDGYIGEIVGALKKRKTYSSEEWLVIITSNHGGTGKSYGNGSARDRNIFMAYYNPKFQPLEITSPSGFDAVKLSAGTILGKVPASKAGIYNLGLTGEYTIEFKLMINSFGTQNAPIFLKTNSAANSNPGWWFVHNGSTGSWRFALRGSQLPAVSQSIKTLNSADPKMVINKWYTIAAKIYMLSGKRYMMIYQDGVQAAAAPIELTGQDISNDIDLQAGWKSGFGNNANQTIMNIKIWNTAIPDSKLVSNVCSTFETPADPYYNNLIGYWPANDGLGEFENISPLGQKRDFILSGAYSWQLVTPYTCGYVAPVISGLQMQMSNNDIAPQLYYWFGAAIGDTWGLDGKVFLTPYESEFIK
ncbi:alkaline phosphatase family protein [Pedobacter frigoris]|nr:alkaline phosphatase family protein [Pedobacter frigoris]